MLLEAVIGDSSGCRVINEKTGRENTKGRELSDERADGWKAPWFGPMVAIVLLFLTYHGA